MEISSCVVLVFMYVLAHLLPLSAATNLCQQAVFLHDTQNGLGVVVNLFAAFQPLPHPSVAVGMKTFCLLLSDRFGKEQHPFLAGSSALQSCNSRFSILKRICTLQQWDTLSCGGKSLHTLPLLSLPSCGSQKIPQQLIFHAQPLNLVSLLCSNVPWRSSFSRPPFGPYRDPASRFRCLARSRFTRLFTTYLSRKPKYSATSLCVFPIQA